MSYDLIAKFQRAASELKASNQKSQDFCRQIIDSPDFHELAKTMVRDAESILRTGFNELKTSADTYHVAMAFIQSEGARGMAKTVFPESLTNIIIAADKKLEGNDKEDFRDFLCLTQAFKDLKENDVAAPFKIFHDDPAKVFIALSI